MPRKKANIHYLYKTTCVITGRYYIGMHSTTNIDDGYMGSGKRLGFSIKKHGKENHTKEIIGFFDSRELLIEGEKKVITSDMIVDKMCMNLCAGGNGWNSNHNKAFLEKLKNDEIFRENYSKKMSAANKKAYSEFESRKKLQEYATENGRDKFNQDMWIRGLDMQIETFCRRSPKETLVIICDVRFINEAEYIKNKNGILFRIIAKQRTELRYWNEATGDQIKYNKICDHQSETDLDKYKFDYIIKNDGELDTTFLDLI